MFCDVPFWACSSVLSSLRVRTSPNQLVVSVLCGLLDFHAVNTFNSQPSQFLYQLGFHTHFHSTFKVTTLWYFTNMYIFNTIIVVVIIRLVWPAYVRISRACDAYSLQSVCLLDSYHIGHASVPTLV